MRIRASVELAIAAAVLGCLVLPSAARACDTGDPAWSPDGRWVAFAGSADPNTSWTIQLVDPGGAAVRVVTTKPPDDPPSRVWTHDFEPSWSPDSQRLAFVSGFLFSSPVYSHSLDGWEVSVETLSSGSVVSVGAGLYPSWSATGLLAWSTFEDPYNDPGGFVAGPLTVTGHAGHPSWSPAGLRIAFDQNGAVWIRRADGFGHPRRLTSGTDPHWSPDGRWIAFVRGHTVRFIRPEAQRPSSLLVLARLPGEEPVWSPDGSRIALGDSILNVRTGHVRNLDVPLGSYPGPSWSPDGRMLVYASDVLTVVRLADGTSRTIDPCTLPPG
jgi:Tol biopolymer transport system component